MKSNAKGVAYTYNEPTIFIEYVLDVAKLAHEKGLFNVIVTNGYMTKEAVRAMRGLIDAAVVDFKGSGEQKFVNKYSAIVSSEPIRDSLLEMKKAGIHIEITDLIIPRVGDSLRRVRRIDRVDLRQSWPRHAHPVHAIPSCLQDDQTILKRRTRL